MTCLPFFQGAFLLLSLAVGFRSGSALAEPWRETSSLSGARMYHTLTLLSDGQVLAVGGGPANTEIYTPDRTGIVGSGTVVAGRWSVAAPLPTARGLHTATLLPDGRVLVVGGAAQLTWDPNFAPIATALLFDPATGGWSATGALLTARASHTATLLPDGRVLVIGGFAGDGPGGATGIQQNSAELYTPSTGQWSSAAPMTLSRGAHTATLLADGSVLVTGRSHGASPDPSGLLAERYDPATNAWSAAGTMLDHRYFHTATRLADGRVLVAGGVVHGSQSRTEIYDPSANAWSAAGNFEPRYDHSATLLPDGKVLVVGGYTGSSGFSAATWRFDPVAPPATAWSTAESLLTGRAAHAAVLLASGRLLVASGAAGAGSAATKAEIYDPSVGRWMPGAPLAGPRPASTGQVGLTPLRDGGLLVVGGSGIPVTAERYDAEAGTWRSAAAPALPREGFSTNLLPDGRVLVAGGTGSGGIASDTERYDPVDDTWSPAAAMANARWQHTATSLNDGSILVAGGVGNAGRVVRAERFRPSSNTWISAGDLPDGRVRHAAVALRGTYVLACGGRSGMTGETPSPTCLVYQPGTPDSWSSGPTMSVARECFTLTLLPDGRVLATGGRGTAGVLATAEIYDPAGMNAWQPTGNLATARCGHSAQVLPDGRVLVSGGTAGAGALSSAEIFDPVDGRWRATPALSGARDAGHAAALLGEGHVLLVGGSDTSATERFDPGRTPDAARRPRLDAVQAQMHLSEALIATGAGLRPTLEAGGGHTAAAAANYPIVQIQALSGGQVRFLRWDAAQPPSDTRYYSRRDAVLGFPTGPAWVRAWVNGTPGTARITVITNESDRLFGNGFN